MVRSSFLFGKAIVPIIALACVAPAGLACAAPVKFQSLYAFKDTGDGTRPYAGLIADSAGNLYGTTASGSSSKTDCGGDGCGTVFKITPKGKETVLYSFGANSGDGAVAEAPLIMDSAGNLYGTTYMGGSAGGAIFKVTSKGKETVLYAFRGDSSDGLYPLAGLVSDASGNLYGTTFSGAVTGCYNNQGCGVYKLTSQGVETVLYSFCSQADCVDGANPRTSLIIDQAGNLYGTTTAGGASNDGTVFELAPDGTETVLHSFAGGDDGADPVAGLVMDASGNLYGTTTFGGPSNGGIVFELAPDGTETVLHAFGGKGDGDDPGYGSLIMDQSGNLYGTTAAGGTRCKTTGGCGAVYEVMPNGSEKVLWSFARKPTGLQPLGSLFMDKAGDLFGTTVWGGNTCTGTPEPNRGCGTVFKLTP